MPVHVIVSGLSWYCGVLYERRKKGESKAICGECLEKQSTGAAALDVI